MYFGNRFTENLANEIPILEEEWLKCTKEIDNIRFDKYSKSIQTYYKEDQTWMPIFWISENGGSMRDSGFFQRLNFEKAIDIAEYLKAYIYGDEGEIIYLPNFGVLFDESDADNIELNIEELQKYKPQFGDDFNRIIQIVNEERKNRIYETPKQEKLEANTSWKTMLLMIILLIFILISVYFLK